MRARLFKLIVAACALLVVLPLSGTAAQGAGPATVDKEGWWNRFSGATSPPESPLRGTAPNPAAPAPEVPEGAIAVGARLGQADKVAALGIVLDAERGATVNRFVLTLKEAEGQGAQQRSEAAKVLACPITSFFAPEANGDFANVPEADCDVAQVEGARADDGTWTFDLAPIAAAWLDPFGAVAANGVRFDPVIENPATSFQVSWGGMEDAVLDVDVTAPTGDAAADPFAAPSSGGGGSFDAPSSSGAGGSSFEAPAPVEVPGEATATTAAPAGGEVVPLETTPAAPASAVGDTFGNLPGIAPVVAVVGLLIALLAAWTLGSGGATAASPRRQGGVSRALAARTEA